MILPQLAASTVQIVPKVWGEEWWIVNTEFYCGKLLKLRKGFRCSRHYHKIKDETFYVLDGTVRWIQQEQDAAWADTRILQRGAVVHVPPLLVHSFAGVEDSTIVEFSTHHDETDSYRLDKSGPMP